MSPYTPGFYLLLAYLSLVFPFGLRVIDETNHNIKCAAEADNNVEKPTKPIEEISPTPPKEARPTGKLLCNMLKNYEVLFFYASLIVSGLSDQLNVYFTLLLIEKEVPNTKAMNSFSLILSSISNIIIFPVSRKIIRLLGGPMQGIMMSFPAYLIR